MVDAAEAYVWFLVKDFVYGQLYTINGGPAARP